MRFQVLGVFVLLLSLTTVSCSRSGRSIVTLDGAGATFPAPLYHKWFDDYFAAHPDVKIGYDATGSGAGIQLFSSGLVDFGASDAAMSDEQMQAVKSGGVQLVPMTAGMIVLAYNLPDVSKQIKLSRDAFSGIFLGKITSWDDPKLKEANPGITLPALKINVIHRAGASGSTFVFTQHLSAVNVDWKHGPGKGLSVQWPTGAGAKGTDEMIALIQQTPGAIGYADFGSASRNKLAVASLENKAGKFVAPSLESCQEALASATMPENLRVWIPDPATQESYPIVTFTWILAHTKYDNATTAAALKAVLKYGLTDGQKDCAPLGYIPLPESVRQASIEAIARIGS